MLSGLSSSRQILQQGSSSFEIGMSLGFASIDG
jgi:hypothetical protein